MIERRSYSRIPAIMDLPDLLEIQTKSYKAFLQSDIPPRLRKKQGLQAGYKLGVPKYTLKECKER